MESITGAIFIDVNFNVDLVWKIVEPLLSPMITPDKLALPAYRELLELCSHLGCFINSKCTSKGDELIIEMTVQLKDELLIAQGHDRNRKSANAKAAARILVDLKVCFLKQTQKVKNSDKLSSSRVGAYPLLCQWVSQRHTLGCGLLQLNIHLLLTLPWVCKCFCCFGNRAFVSLAIYSTILDTDFCIF
jgi:tRNA-binding EMAP/Myf-like protein